MFELCLDSVMSDGTTPVATPFTALTMNQRLFWVSGAPRRSPVRVQRLQELPALVGLTSSKQDPINHGQGSNIAMSKSEMSKLLTECAKLHDRIEEHSKLTQHDCDQVSCPKLDCPWDQCKTSFITLGLRAEVHKAIQWKGPHSMHNLVPSM